MLKLVKAWNRAEPGTAITMSPAEAEREGATLVDPARFDFLLSEGFFGQPEEVAKQQAEHWERLAASLEQSAAKETAEKSAADVSDLTDGTDSSFAGNWPGSVPEDVPTDLNVAGERITGWDEVAGPQPSDPALDDDREAHAATVEAQIAEVVEPPGEVSPAGEVPAEIVPLPSPPPRRRSNGGL